MINDSILLNPNESSSSSSTVSLRSLQEILHNRIIQKKAEMHRTKNTGDITDRVCTEIETLQWVGSNTYAAAMIINRQEIKVHFGPNYHAKFSFHTHELHSYTDFI
jgi:hypothetical protein